ncbi:MAG: rhamnulokinase [Gemmatimonadota bacterium]|nr:MAG: rhamnulokinase [Gemmatimonadota bacterium]
MSSQQPGSYLAFDLGASTSRALLGALSGPKLELNELHRFTTPVLEIGDHLFWDVDAMWAELVTGLEKAKAATPGLRSLSVDSWAVDYVPLDASGTPIRNPHCYRDPRTEGVMERAFEVMPASDIYSVTGIQFLPFNTLYQVLADVQTEGYGGAAHKLPIADYFNYRFSGRQAIEVSMASTTQFMDVNTRQWSASLMEKFGLDTSLWPEIIPSGTRLGSALQEPRVEVLATCSHDTGAAVAAAPAVAPDENWTYISCGTWSLMGVERRAPLLTDAAREAGFTNEAGLDGTIRFLKNLTGLWVLQECMREWSASSRIDWGDLEREARVAIGTSKHTGDDALIDLENKRFLPRGPMEHRIHAYRHERGLRTLESRGEIVLAVLSSIAASYRSTLAQLESITGTAYDRIHLFGGGSQNALLCELTANACKCEVVAGPVEATALGNLLIQARTMGDLPAGMSIRDASAASSDLKVYLPDFTDTHDTK